MFAVVNDFYTGIFLMLYQVWKQQHKTIADSGFVIKGKCILLVVGHVTVYSVSPSPGRDVAHKDKECVHHYKLRLCVLTSLSGDGETEYSIQGLGLFSNQ